MNIEVNELDELLNYLETTSLEPHNDYTSEFTYKDQKILYKYIKDLQQERDKYKSVIDEAIELRKEFLDVNENQLIVFENNELIVFMNKLHDILNKVGDK